MAAEHSTGCAASRPSMTRGESERIFALRSWNARAPVQGDDPMALTHPIHAKRCSWAVRAMIAPPDPMTMAGIHITDIEVGHQLLARHVSPRPMASRCLRRHAALAEVYALMVYSPPDGSGRVHACLPEALAGLDGVVREHARHALHCHLLHQPGRRRVQGLWPQLFGGAVVDRDAPGRKAGQPGAASRWKAAPGGSTNMPNAPPKVLSDSLQKP